MSTYWQRRVIKQQELLYDKTLLQTQKDLAKAYKQSINAIKQDMSDLYDKLLKDSIDGTVRPNDLYKFNRYYELQNKINKNLKTLGEAEIKINNSKFTNMYNKTNDYISKELADKLVNIDNGFTLFNENRVNEVINSIWCQDGKAWSSRIWDNKALLQDRLNKGFTDCIVRGVSKDELVKQLQADMGVGFNQADRIARTELTHIQNQACADSYQKAGIKKYEFLAEIDSRTSDICTKLNGRIFDFSEKQVGINFPPCHVNCRSTIIAVI